MEQTTPISTTMRAVVKQVQACCLLVCDCMTGQEVLDFQYSSFLGNEVDIQNVCDHPVDVSGAVFD